MNYCSKRTAELGDNCQLPTLIRELAAGNITGTAVMGTLWSLLTIVHVLVPVRSPCVTAHLVTIISVAHLFDLVHLVL